jgi:RNA polymerase-binding transcription factor DksA
MTVGQLLHPLRVTMLLPATAQRLRRQLDQALEVHTGLLAGRGVEVDDDIQMALGRLAERTVGEIRSALERMDRRTYGVCESCVLPIAPDRLEAIPYARFCSTCAVTAPRV